MGISVFNTAAFRSAVAEVCDPGLYGRDVRVVLRNDAVELTAIDGVAGMRSRVGGMVAQEITTCLPAAILRSVAGALPADEVQLQFGQNALITSGAASFELSVLAEQLPDWEEGAPSLSVDGALLAQGLSAVQYAGAREAHHATRFGGVCFDLDGEALTLVATDSRRLALYRIDGLSHEPLQRTIRLADAKKLTRIAGRGGSVALAFEQGRIVAATDRTSLACAVLYGAFPDYRRILPSAFASEIAPDAGMLLQALKRVPLTANDTTRAVALRADGEGLTLSAASDLGTSAERVAVANFSGQPFEVSFDAKYLYEAIEKAAGPVRLRFSSATAPLVVEPVEASGYRALLMPMAKT